MKDLKIEECKISRMQIEKGVISWDDHGIRIPEIVRTWVGDIPKKSFPLNMILILLMIALSSPSMLNLAVMLAILTAYALAHIVYWKSDIKNRGTKHVNLELSSGKIYSFATESEGFAGELHETLRNLLAVGSTGLRREILFEDGGKIIDQPEAPRLIEPITSATVRGSAPDSPIMRELQKLHELYTAKVAVDNEIVALIDEAKTVTAENDRNGLKVVFSQFVTSGLINDCNELSLDSLLQEIKSVIY